MQPRSSRRFVWPLAARMSLACLLSVTLAAAALAQHAALATAGDSWMQATDATIRELEAAWRPLDGGVVASHRGQGLRASVSGGVLRVVPRAAQHGAAWALELETLGISRDVAGGAAREPTQLPAGALSWQGRRAELRRAGWVEWFVNAPQGLQQGWTVERPPPAARTHASSAGELCIELRIDGLTAHVGADPGSALLLDALGAATLSYSGLQAWDAAGRALDARLAERPGGLAVLVDDAHAVYPVTIDPVVGGTAWALAGDQADAWLGWSVAGAGDVNGDGYDDVIVGADEYDTLVSDGGAAFVFHGSAAGLASTPAWSSEFDLQADAHFGFCVAPAGDIDDDGYDDVIIGMPYRSVFGTSSGQAFVWRGSADGLGASPDWSAVGEFAWGEFGATVAGLGDVNGDGFDDVGVGFDGVGLVRAWFGGAAGLGPTGTAANADWEVTGLSNYFGDALAGAGDVDGDGDDEVLIGSRFDGAFDQGQVFLYEGGVQGPSTTPDWTGTGGAFEDGYGAFVDSAGDVNADGFDDVVVGAWLANGFYVDAGQVLVYHGSATGLSPAAAWDTYAEQPFARLGCCVAGAGDVNGDGYDDILAGAIFWDAASDDVGGAFVWLGSADGITDGAMWTRTGSTSLGQYGLSVAAAGDVNADGFADLIVGEPQAQVGALVDAGRATLYLGGPGGVAATPAWIATGDQASCEFSRSLASGDIDGDGYSDIVVGAPAFDAGQGNEGAAFVFFGSASGLDTADPWMAQSDQALASFGQGVASGDVDGDGFDDLLVGAWSWDAASNQDGAVFLWKGGALGLGDPGTPLNADWSTFGQSLAAFGWAVDAADVDGDGDDDVLVGAPYATQSHAEEGAVFVFTSDGTLPTTPPSFAQYGGAAGAQMGWSLANAGDVDADGFEDVIVGLPGSDHVPGSEIFGDGRVQLYHGTAGGLSSSVGWSAEITQDGALFGEAVAGAGDVDGDGYDDVLVGAAAFDAPAASPEIHLAGLACLFHGSPSGLTPNPGTPDNAAWSYSLAAPTAVTGKSVAGAGDVNADGYADVILGATGASLALLFVGSAQGLSETAEWIASESGSLGWTVAGAGDVDGDGLADVVAGAIAYTDDQSHEGAVFVYRGSLTEPWFDLGNALTGLRGEPRLLGSGALIEGQPVQLMLTNAREDQTAYLVLGAAAINLPLKGGVLVPSPDLLVVFPTFDGQATLPFAWPQLPSGSDVYFQIWISDDSGPVHFAATNGLGATVP